MQAAVVDACHAFTPSSHVYTFTPSSHVYTCHLLVAVAHTIHHPARARSPGAQLPLQLQHMTGVRGVRVERLGVARGNCKETWFKETKRSTSIFRRS